MTKGIFGGMTDYSHQSFKDIINDLRAERKNAIRFVNAIESNVQILKSNSYWDNDVPYNFRSIITHSIKLFKTTVYELKDIRKGILRRVERHHIERLIKISNQAYEVNILIGKIWNTDYLIKEYGNGNFRIVDQIYVDTRDMAVNLLDIENIAVRLKDFIGKEKKKAPIGIIIAAISLLVAILALLFGENIFDRHSRDKDQLKLEQLDSITRDTINARHSTPVSRS